MREKINNIIGKINNKENWKLSETEHYYIYNILYMFLKDYLITERLSEKTEEEILQYSNTEIYEAKQILNLLYKRGILLKSIRQVPHGNFVNIYCLSYVYIKDIENMITNHNPDIEIKKTSDIIAEAEYVLKEYQKFNNRLIGCIAEILEYGFNFHAEIDNGKIDFQMGGCDYNVYLSRGYIVLEEADNSTIENTWTVEDVNEFIDLIKDLWEDN